MPRWSGWYWTTSTPTSSAHSTKHLRQCEARRIAQRLEFHYTPTHGSWLNPVLSLPKGWLRSS